MGALGRIRPPTPPAHTGGYAPHVDLTLIEAWNLWWSGKQLVDHSIHGAPVLWLSRAGKMLAFLAGATIVLDAIGPERLVKWGEDAKGKLHEKLTSKVIYLIAGVIAVPLIYWIHKMSIMEPRRAMVWIPAVSILVMPVVMVAMGILAGVLVGGLGKALADRRLEKIIRRIAVPLFFLGFGLDYLAS